MASDYESNSVDYEALDSYMNVKTESGSDKAQNEVELFVSEFISQRKEIFKELKSQYKKEVDMVRKNLRRNSGAVVLLASL